ncbi:MAG: ABC transporter permease [Bacteroidia bacterium]
MNRERLILNFNIAFDAVLGNLLRSVLTALGIIFGVAAVIAMLAIGKGAQKEILDQLKLVGVNNIEIKSSLVLKDGSGDTSKVRKRYTPGLCMQDIEAIRTIVPHVANVCPEGKITADAYFKDIKHSVNLIGTQPSFFDIFHFKLNKGNSFSKEQLQKGLAVCIIGKNVESKLFRGQNALGKYIKSQGQWLRVIGVTEKIGVSSEPSKIASVRDYNNDIYVPVQAYLALFKEFSTDGQMVSGGSWSMFKEGTKNINYHPLDRIIVQVNQSEMLNPTGQLLQKLLLRRHNETADFEIVIPELLLKQEQRSKDIFNWVLLSIAFISLLVGGIGIMNIMLASVYERIKEIGIRMSMGAHKRDIIQQFLLEAVIISLTGGFIGIFLGVVISLAITMVTDIQTIISWTAVIVSFVVSATVGLIFGIMPARKAAMQDPITSLRHE